MPPERAEFGTLLEPLIVELGLELSQGQVDALFDHYSLLWRWNDRMNLTSIRRLEEVVQRHFGESLAVARAIGPGNGGVVDIGSGAGFPGVPVAVCFPSREVTLVESVGKKATFLKEAARTMRNVQVFGGRFDELEGEFEWGTWRAVAGAGLKSKLERSVGKVAVLVGALLAEETAAALGLSGVETRTIPWDARTVVVTGRVA
jgi:16S rRNA (guanine527-N7)-methyltransferase